MNHKILASTLLIILTATGCIWGYLSSARNPLTLAIEAKTMERGMVRVFWDSGAGFEEKASRQFAIDDDQGNLLRYELELPKTTLQSLRIAPLSRPGTFEISIITLANRSISYFWDSDGVCSQQTLLPDRATKEPCSGGLPVLTIADDASIIISSLPDRGFTNPTGSRITFALAIAVAILFSSAWLRRPTGKTGRSDILHCYAVRSLWLVIAGLYLYQFSLVAKFAVDVPYTDEWEYFAPGALTSGFSWQWLFGFHNQHRIVPTKLLAWLDLRLFSLDFGVLKLVNYAIFGSLLLLVAGYRKRVTGTVSFVYFPAFLLFMLSPLAVENHLWGYQSQFHLVLIFAAAALYYISDTDHTAKATVLFTLFTLLAIYTFSAGVVFALVATACRSLYIAFGSSSNQIPARSGWKAQLLSCVVIATGMLLWTYGYQKPEVALVSPLTFQFWEYFLNTVSLGFGFTDRQLATGILSLVIVLSPAALLLGRRDSRWQPATWQVSTAILAILAILGTISMGRGNVDLPKSSRYAEIAFMLIPYTALAWWLAIGAKRWRPAILALLWLFCMVGYADNWSQAGYRQFSFLGESSLECIENYYRGRGTDLCPDTFPRPLAKYLDGAKHLQVRFTRQFETMH